MRQIHDKNFDKLFKERMAKELLPFEEESWLKMEKKLDKKEHINRFVFYRNVGIILMFLSFGLGFYILNKTEPTHIANKTPNEIHKKERIEKTLQEKGQSIVVKKADINPERSISVSNNQENRTFKPINNNNSKPEKIEESIALSPLRQNIIDTAKFASKTPKITDFNNIANEINEITDSAITNRKPKSGLKNSKKSSRIIPISVAFSFGPDFNSTNNLVGGKGNIAFGFSIGFGLFKRVSLQTGINYGSKNYTANSYNYTFSNPYVASKIAKIDADCRVLEIPLRASFALLDFKKSSIDLNAGLSSYLMLKEDYNFIYTAASGQANRLVEKTNANQHYLSVIDLSATYNIKLKSKKFAFGLEPYVKIPLSGIGEGNVRLKSSGISLKLRYDVK